MEIKKPKKFNTETTAEYIEALTDNKITVKEYITGGKCTLHCNLCNKDFKYRFCDFTRAIIKENKILHSCKARCNKMTNEEFLNKVNSLKDIEEGEYTFLEEYIDYSTKILCKHNVCGHEWKVAPKHFTGGMMTRCPICSCKKSRYEELINSFLIENNISFIRQYSDSILNKRSFDFAIINESKILGFIEFDGEQHYKIKFGMSEEEFKKQQESDLFKDNYALENNIPLLRIKYKDRVRYKDIILNFLNSLSSSTTIETTDDNLEGSRVEPSGSGVS